MRPFFFSTRKIIECAPFFEAAPLTAGWTKPSPGWTKPSHLAGAQGYCSQISSRRTDCCYVQPEDNIGQRREHGHLISKIIVVYKTAEVCIRVPS